MALISVFDLIPDKYSLNQIKNAFKNCFLTDNITVEGNITVEEKYKVIVTPCMCDVLLSDTLHWPRTKFSPSPAA